jgi:Ergosterol biosynthesis ERG4/ERG24 family
MTSARHALSVSCHLLCNCPLNAFCNQPTIVTDPVLRTTNTSQPPVAWLCFLSTLTMTAQSQPRTANPRTTSYEFLGPPGAFAVTFGVPFMTYVLYFSCNESSGGCLPPTATLLDSFTQAVSDPLWWAKLWDPTATALYFAWYAFCLFAWYVLPGDWVKGAQLRDGRFQHYKINGRHPTILPPPRI